MHEQTTSPRHVLEILSVTAPIYLLMLCGYLAVRQRVLAPADLRVLGRFAFLFGITALIFEALATRRVFEIIDAAYLFAYAAGSVAMLLLGWAWARLRRGAPQPLAALQGMGMGCPNSGYIGYPIALGLAGPVAGVALALCLLVENLFVLPLAMAMADARGGQTPRAALRAALAALARNPLVWAMAAGIAWSTLQWPLPTPVAKVLRMMAGATAPVGLFVVGGSLVGLQLQGLRGDLARVAWGKLVMHPLAVGTLLWLWPPADPALAPMAVIFAAMPMLGIYTVLAQKHGEAAFCAAAQLITTLASFITISAWLWLLSTLRPLG